MVINKELLDELSRKATASPRLRMNLDLRTSASDMSQRMLNAIEPETVIPIHRHLNSSESCIILRGSAEEIFYNDNGCETEHVLMKAGSECVGVNIEAGCWHKIVALEAGTVIFESKNGAYEAITPKDILEV